MPFLGGLYLVLVGITCFLYGSKNSRNRYTFFKLMTSLCFVGIACYAAILGGLPILFFFLLPGFWFAVAGDYLLGIAHTREDYRGKEFLSGAIMFMFAHAAFYIALSTIQDIGVKDFVFPLVFSAVMFFVLRSKSFSLGKMLIPGMAYAFFVALLLSKGAMLVIFDGSGVRNLLILAGGVLFLISDGVLLFMYFHISPKKNLGAVNLGTYYSAMVMLGLCIYPFN